MNDNDRNIDEKDVRTETLESIDWARRTISCNVAKEVREMTIEDDFLSIIQGVLLVVGPILLLQTVNLWRGILIGGLAKTQTWIAFSSDPMTILSIVACLAVMLGFWIYVFTFGKHE
jgi:hypothetical protein